MNNWFKKTFLKDYITKLEHQKDLDYLEKTMKHNYHLMEQRFWNAVDLLKQGKPLHTTDEFGYSKDNPMFKDE